MASFDFPDVEIGHELLALQEPGCYAIERGRRVSGGGLVFPAGEFGQHVAEHQVPHSNRAARRHSDGGRYLTGPLARYTISSAQLSAVAREAAAAAGLGPACRNPFRSIVVRAVEAVYAADEALRIIGEYERPDAGVRRRATEGGVRLRCQRGA